MMTEIQSISNIEHLPNEVLLECFQYFNGVDILYSFDQLNIRFNRLIRNVPLHVHFDNTHRLTFAQICKVIAADDEIQQHIYSLNLSNENVHHQIHDFVSLFSFDIFPHLQSLSLTAVQQSDLFLLESMFALISNLTSFKLFHTDNNTIEKLFRMLPKIHLQTLTFPRLFFHFESTSEFLSITKLIIAQCGLYQLHQFMINIPHLKYFKIEHFNKTYSFIWDYLKRLPYDYYMAELNDLIIMNCEDQFENIASILKRTPNLNNLTIATYGNTDQDMIDANLWQTLIDSSLPYLNNFQFVFQCLDWCDRHLTETKFQKFQSDFWCQQHRWYTEYTFAKNIGEIYTIPYLLNTFEIRSNMERYSNHQLENTHEDTFKHVTDLTTVYSNIVMEKCQLFFAHVTSMKLEMIFESPKLRINSKELKMIVKLTNVKHLIIPSYFGMETLSDLSELLVEMQHISSLNICSNSLKSLFKDDYLCQYFNEKITKLKLTDSSDYFMDHSLDLKQFCDIFSNLEELQCNIDQYDSFLFLLKSLPKLSLVTVFSPRFPSHSVIDWPEEYQLGGKIIRDFHQQKSQHLSIWFMPNTA